MIEFHPKAHRNHFDEVMNWLLKEHDPRSNSFYNQIDNIEQSFRQEEMSCLVIENKTIGYVTWRFNNKIAYIDIFEIHPAYRNKRMGREFFSKLKSYFISCGIYVVELKYISEESQAFWKKLGFLEFAGNDFPSVTDKHLYKVIVESQPSTTESSNNSYLEIWDNNCMSDRKPIFKTFNLNFEYNGSSKLVLPIITPCHHDWTMRLTINGKPSNTLKIKYFNFIKYHPNFLILESL